LARGIDGVAHRTALKLGIPTIAVLGTALDTVFPLQHLELQKNIAQEGLLLGEIAPGFPTEAWRFAERNRVIAALSDAVIVVEAPLKSGALVTAKYALELGREIFVVPGPLTLESNEGGHRLIQDGAHLFTNVKEVIEIIGFCSKRPLGDENLNSPATEPMPLNGEEALLMGLLREEPQHIDKLILISHLPAPLVSSTLTGLQLKGWVEELEGCHFKKINDYK
jgi:DNA processing protein